MSNLQLFLELTATFVPISDFWAKNTAFGRNDIAGVPASQYICGISHLFNLSFMENSNQMMRLTGGELLALWKTHLRLDDVRRDCVVERDDGIDLDAWLMQHINRWYSRLLSTAPAEWLPVDDVKADVTLTLLSDGAVRASVPAQAVRPVEWQLDSWSRSVTEFAAPGSEDDKRQALPWLKGGACHPVAVDHGNHIMLFSHTDAGTMPALSAARCVIRPADGQFVFHAQAMNTFPSLDQLRAS